MTSCFQALSSRPMTSPEFWGESNIALPEETHHGGPGDSTPCLVSPLLKELTRRRASPPLCAQHRRLQEGQPPPMIPSLINTQRRTRPQTLSEHGTGAQVNRTELKETRDNCTTFMNSTGLIQPFLLREKKVKAIPLALQLHEPDKAVVADDPSTKNCVPGAVATLFNISVHKAESLVPYPPRPRRARSPE